MSKPPKVKNFPQLIRWIAEEYHEGHVLPIASRVGVSPALVGLWSRGQTAEPRALNLQRLADVYNLDFLWVLGLVHGKGLTPIRGGSAVAEPPAVGRSRMVAEPTPHPLPLAKCAPIRDIMSIYRGLTHHRWYPTSHWPTCVAA